MGSGLRRNDEGRAPTAPARRGTTGRSRRPLINLGVGAGLKPALWHDTAAPPIIHGTTAPLPHTSGRPRRRCVRERRGARLAGVEGAIRHTGAGRYPRGPGMGSGLRRNDEGRAPTAPVCRGTTGRSRRPLINLGVGAGLKPALWHDTAAPPIIHGTTAPPPHTSGFRPRVGARGKPSTAGTTKGGRPRRRCVGGHPSYRRRPVSTGAGGGRPRRRCVGERRRRPRRPLINLGVGAGLKPALWHDTAATPIIHGTTAPLPHTSGRPRRRCVRERRGARLAGVEGAIRHTGGGRYPRGPGMGSGLRRNDEGDSGGTP